VKRNAEKFIQKVSCVSKCCCTVFGDILWTAPKPTCLFYDWKCALNIFYVILTLKHFSKCSTENSDLFYVSFQTASEYLLSKWTKIIFALSDPFVIDCWFCYVTSIESFKCWINFLGKSNWKRIFCDYSGLFLPLKNPFFFRDQPKKWVYFIISLLSKCHS